MPNTNVINTHYKKNPEQAVKDLGVEDARMILGQEIDTFLSTQSAAAMPTVSATPSTAAATSNTPAATQSTAAAATSTAPTASPAETPAVPVDVSPAPSSIPTVVPSPSTESISVSENTAVPEETPAVPIVISSVPSSSPAAEASTLPNSGVSVESNGDVEDILAANVVTPMVGSFDININGNKTIKAVLTRDGEDPKAATGKEYCETYDLLQDFYYSICTKTESGSNKVKDACVNTQDGKVTLKSDCIPQDFKDMYSGLTGNSLPEEIEI
jgi:hypothetical protein